MASILDRYGIKEVADVTFYALDSNGKPTYPVLYLDTLKVSTIEQTAETTEARGGKGNPALISWDYGKEINVSLEDALFSAKSMAIMFGNGTVIPYSTEGCYIMKTEVFVAEANGSVPAAATSAADGSKVSGWNQVYVAPNGMQYIKKNPKFYPANASGSAFDGTDTSALVNGQKYFCSYDISVDGSIIEVSGDSFPGTYYVTGDTYARNQASGKDEFFQFIIPKAKVTSENTITLEAEGDPSVFNMNLKVLRPDDGVMMKLVTYNPVNGAPATETLSTMVHNHQLLPVTEGTAG